MRLFPTCGHTALQLGIHRPLFPRALGRVGHNGELDGEPLNYVRALQRVTSLEARLARAVLGELGRIYQQDCAQKALDFLHGHCMSLPAVFKRLQARLEVTVALSRPRTARRVRGARGTHLTLEIANGLLVFVAVRFAMRLLTFVLVRGCVAQPCQLLRRLQVTRKLLHARDVLPQCRWGHGVPKVAIVICKLSFLEGMRGLANTHRGLAKSLHSAFARDHFALLVCYGIGAALQAGLLCFQRVQAICDGGAAVVDFGLILCVLGGQVAGNLTLHLLQDPLQCRHLHGGLVREDAIAAAGVVLPGSGRSDHACG
mmetsp:Transcript_43945/g.110362  ORF Transcript_43945/g.110362 Transcript_43945/m.110362 type:complete len:314 (-) Transcript_43945:359-1300(-)